MKKVILALVLFALPAAAQVSNQGWWSVTNTPVAATAASASKTGAGGTVKHVATSATVCISAVAAQADIVFNLRDGATGAGTILWTVRLGMPTAGQTQCVTSPPLNLVGTANTAMTLESAAAPAATNFATVSLSGYDTL